VDVEVTARPDPQIEEAVLREELEHVIEERDAGRDFRAAAAVDGETELDVGLLRLSRDGRGASAVPRWSAASTHCHQAPPPMPSRRSIARPCASRPSSRASRTIAGPSRAIARGVASITLVRFTKS